MELTSRFLCTIQFVRYVEKPSRPFDNTDVNYIAEAIVKESKRGCNNIKESHKVHLYMDKVDFDRHIISVGDRVLIDNARWICYPLEYTNYNPDFIKKHKGSKLRKNEKGKTYYCDTVYTYVIRAEIGDWKIVKKNAYPYHCIIPYIRVFLPMDNRQDFDNDMFGWFLEDYEFEKVKDLNGYNTDIDFYKGKNKIGHKKILIATDEEINYLGCKVVDNDS